MERKNITKEKFLELVKEYKNSDSGNVMEPENSEGEDEDRKNEEEMPATQEGNEKMEDVKPKEFKRQVLVFIPVTIPSTGKTSLFRIVSERNPEY